MDLRPRRVVQSELLFPLPYSVLFARRVATVSDLRTDPSLSDVVVRSRNLADSCQLVPPAKFPALFTCTYHGVPAIGCVYRSGPVCIMPDQFGCLAQTPCVFANMLAVESDGRVAEIAWEWQVTRILSVCLSVRVPTDGEMAAKED